MAEGVRLCICEEPGGEPSSSSLSSSDKSSASAASEAVGNAAATTFAEDVEEDPVSSSDKSSASAASEAVGNAAATTFAEDGEEDPVPDEPPSCHAMAASKIVGWPTLPSASGEASVPASDASNDSLSLHALPASNAVGGRCKEDPVPDEPWSLYVMAASMAVGSPTIISASVSASASASDALGASGREWSLECELPV